MATQFNSLRFLLALTGCAMALAGCSDSGETGGGAGDGVDPGEASLVEPFVGLWDITGTWSGEPDDEAVLVFRALDANGESDALIYDFDDGGENCYFRLPITGVVEESVDNRVFLSRLPQFAESILTLDSSENIMTIAFTDQLDSNNNGNITERLTYTAVRITAFTESDIQVCSFSS